MQRYLKTFALTALAGGLALGMMPQAKAEEMESLKFTCNYDSQTQQFSTMREGSDRPLIVWTETLSSDHPLGAYTPGNRCHAVSTRLTNLAKSIGPDRLGQMSQLGYVNGSWVIFNSEYRSPIRDEVVFTLKPENNYNSRQVLTQFRFNVVPIGGEGPNLPDSVLQPIVE